MNPEVQINFFFEIDFGRVWLQLRWMSRLKMSFFTSIHRIGSIEVPKRCEYKKIFFHRLLKVEIAIGLAFVELNSQNKFHQKIVKYYHHFDCTIVFFASLFHVISRPVDRWELLFGFKFMLNELRPPWTSIYHSIRRFDMNICASEYFY